MKNYTVRVTPDELRDTAYQFEQNGARIKAMTDRMGEIANELNRHWIGRRASGYTSRIFALRDDSDRLNRKIQEHVRDLRKMADNYDNAEGNSNTSAEALGENPIEGAVAFGSTLTLFPTFFRDLNINCNPEDDDAFFEKKMGKDADGNSIPGHRWDYSGNTEDVNKYDRLGSLAEIQYEQKAEVHWIDGEISGESKYAEGSLSGGIGNAEAGWETSVGVYIYEQDNDGNIVRRIAPGILIGGSASASLFEGSASGRVGWGENHDMLGLNGSVEAAVGEAGVSGKFTVDLFNKNPQAGVSFKAEANAVKVEGKAGVTVVGADIDVSGAVKIGAGAHADIGFTDGKLRVDIGAALGVGADIGFSVDVGGLIDYIEKGVGSLWSIWFK